eukprot:CAMPEP_0168177398 /NCGR_PEP_ID=MMETSP0139_2-20121125/8426_1 /TAXON_ID=44445 /ORGANISM="Pseudo-nitzschia australis, Strain 10249 10 AB" /LENGTH=464 /DNA_ID=CAMNT_0008096433 /DNA_START=46 /DNA_END=1440 /DNA_ORIENTATION=-
MTEPTVNKTIEEYLTKAQMKPITKDRTSIDISIFREAVGNTLTNITSIYSEEVAEDLGHAYLVDKLHHYRKRREDHNACLPKPQPRPKKPTVMEAYTQKTYLYSLKPYWLSQNLDREARALISKKFPDSLAGLMCPATQCLPPSVTARAAFDYIEEMTGATAAGNMRHQELLRGLINREYVPGISTAELYFNQCETDQHRINAIGVAVIPDAQIMVGAQLAFRKVIDSTVMQLIDNAWTTLSTASLYSPPDEVYRQFKVHYCKGLWEYYHNMQGSRGNRKNQAYAVDALSDTVSQLQNELSLTQDNVCSIANTQDQMLAQPESYTTQYVPSVVSATTASTPSGLAHSAVDNRLDKLEGLFQQLVQQQLQGNQSTARNNTRRGTIRGDPNGPWRQWKYWCYSCGTNLSHNTIDCHRTKNQLPDHDQFKTTATRDNPQGGNSKKDHLWLKWCDPGTYEPCSTKGGE